MLELQILKANVETIRALSEEMLKVADTKENEARPDGEINAYTNVINMIETLKENE